MPPLCRCRARGGAWYAGPVTGGFLLLILVVGVVLFVGKLLMTRGAAWIERWFNAEIAELTEMANREAPPATWLAEAETSPNPEVGKERLLSRLDRAIARVDGGRAFEREAREFAVQRLRQLRQRWAEQTLEEIRAAVSEESA